MCLSESINREYHENKHERTLERTLERKHSNEHNNNNNNTNTQTNTNTNRYVKYGDPWNKDVSVLMCEVCPFLLATVLCWMVIGAALIATHPPEHEVKTCTQDGQFRKKWGQSREDYASWLPCWMKRFGRGNVFGFILKMSDHFLNKFNNNNTAAAERQRKRRRARIEKNKKKKKRKKIEERAESERKKKKDDKGKKRKRRKRKRRDQQDGGSNKKSKPTETFKLTRRGERMVYYTNTSVKTLRCKTGISSGKKINVRTLMCVCVCKRSLDEKLKNIQTHRYNG